MSRPILFTKRMLLRMSQFCQLQSRIRIQCDYSFRPDYAWPLAAREEPLVLGTVLPARLVFPRPQLPQCGRDTGGAGKGVHRRVALVLLLYVGGEEVQVDTDGRQA